MKPILFNTDMVRAILEGRKTATRRVVRPQPAVEMPDNHNICKMPIWTKDGQKSLWYMDVIEQYPFKRTRYFEQLAPFEPGDTLYVQETWTELFYVDEGGYTHYDQPMYFYAADGTPDITLRDADGFTLDDQRIRWRPSIHMPKEAARIFLRVTGVRVERLQDITPEQIDAEGFKEYGYSAETGELMPSGPSIFMIGWNETIKPTDRATYGWDANPWVWVIEFERISREETVR